MLRTELTIPSESWRIPFDVYQSTQESERRTRRSDEANLRPGRVAGGPRGAFQAVVQDGRTERICEPGVGIGVPTRRGHRLRSGSEHRSPGQVPSWLTSGPRPGRA